MLKRLIEVFTIMRESGLYLNIKKIELIQNHTLALGHIISQLGLSPNPKKVQGIRDSKIFTNIKELHSFLGSVNFLTKYILHCAQIQEPLIELTRKGAKFEMTEERIKAFNHIKNIISECTLLSTPQGSEDFVVICGASEVGLGAVLLQVQQEDLVPLEFASKVLSKAERNWSAYEREAFAIRWTIVLAVQAD